MIPLSLAHLAYYGVSVSHPSAVLEEVPLLHQAASRIVVRACRGLALPELAHEHGTVLEYPAPVREVPFCPITH